MNTGYAYIYDDFLADRRFERELAAFETRLNAFDLAGRIGRMSLFRSARDLVEGMVDQGASTVVIVGNDGTLDKTMWFLPDLPVTIGYIPLVGPSAVGRLLGITEGPDACNVLAARLIETLDMGRLDDRYFLTEVTLPLTTAVLNVEGRYKVAPINGGSMAIRNLGGIADPKDGMLEAVITPYDAEKRGLFRRKSAAPGQPTSVMFRYGELVSQEPVEACVDNHAVSGFKFNVSVVPEKLRLITGRGRRRSTEDGMSLPRRAKNATLHTATNGSVRRRMRS